MWLCHCSAKSFGPSYYFLSLCGVSAIICAGRSWMWRGKPSSTWRRGNQSHEACPKSRMIIIFWGRTLRWCKSAKAPQLFAKEHQRVVILISFTYGNLSPARRGCPMPGEGQAVGEGAGAGQQFHAPVSRGDALLAQAVLSRAAKLLITLPLCRASPCAALFGNNRRLYCSLKGRSDLFYFARSQARLPRGD